MGGSFTLDTRVALGHGCDCASYVTGLHKRMNMKCWIQFVLMLSAAGSSLVCGTAHADLVVKVEQPKQVGQKIVIKLTMRNTFKEKVESARAQVFLLDENGSVAGQAVRWVIGGAKDRPALAPVADTAFNFVVETSKPFTSAKVSFSRVVLEGGKLADVNKEVQIQQADH